MAYFAEYIWLDGAKPTQTLRSKARVIPEFESPELSDFPEWGYDGSSTNQAKGSNSDLILKPVNFVPDPTKGPGNYLVLCEVFNADGTPHSTNHRAVLRHILDNGGSAHEPTLGFEQEYTLYQGRIPLGWPENGFPQAQGPFYCGVGSDRAYGRELVELHADMCLDAGLLLYGINAEVMPGQWEFQIGYRGFENDDAAAINVCDHLWIACWLLHRLGEDFDVWANFDNKPIRGDWNGAGCHTNFSTKNMRDPEKGRTTIDKAIVALSKKHNEHIELYGHDLDTRLTGDHETCSIAEFKSGVSDRGSSIRIPLGVEKKGYGYLEDRRPGANADPYLVAARLIATICEVDDSIFDKVIYKHPLIQR
jgi:glutamine synthetase